MGITTVLKWALPVLAIGALTSYAIWQHIETLRLKETITRMQAQNQITQIKSTALLQKTIADNKVITERNEKNAQQIAEDYANTITNIKNVGNDNIVCFNNRVRFHSPSFSSRNKNPVSQKNSTAPKPDATSPNPMAVRSLPTDCAVTTAQVLALQKYVVTECAP